MKKTKLLTSLAALALVVGLGACEVNVDVGGVEVGDVDVGVDVNPGDSSGDNTSEDTSEDVNTSETTSKDETTSETTSEGGSTGENTSEDDTSDNTSSGDTGEDDDESETNYEKNDLNDMIAEINEDHNYNATSYFYVYQSDAVSVDYQGDVSLSAVARYATDIYATEDACLIEYLQYTTGSSGPGWYYVDIELYVNDYTNGLTEVYYINGSSIYDLALADYYYGTWSDNIGNLGDLMDSRSAITTDWSLLGYSEYDVDSSAYEAIMNATIANTYLWDSAFGSYGFNRYMNGASDFSYALTDTLGYMTSGFVGAEFSFDSGAAWYYTDYTYQYIFAQEAITYTDITGIGTTAIPSGWSSYL